VDFFQRRIHFITGKGGVGRTTLTAALSLAAAKAGRRVLACEVSDPDGGPSVLGPYLGLEDLDEQPRSLPQVSEGPEVCRLWAPRGHELFLRSILPKTLVRAGLRSRSLHKFLNAAPSFYEMGIMYHLLYLEQLKLESGAPRWEQILIDMPATGHALAFTSLPEVLLRLMPRGPVARAIRAGQQIFNDPERTVAWVVTLPEQLPISEALELAEGLSETGIEVGGFLLNRFTEWPFSQDELVEMQAWFQGRPVHGAEVVEQIQEARRERARLERESPRPVLPLPQQEEEPIPELMELFLRQWRLCGQLD